MSNRTETKLEFVGTAGVNPLVIGVSSPRCVMDNSHVSQKLTLIRPDEPIVKSGIEYELGKYIDDVRADHDYIVKAIVHKYPNGELSSEVAMIVEYEENGRSVLDLVIIPEFVSNHSLFGYKLHPTEEFKNLYYNATIPEGTVLGKTSTLGREGSYNFTVNANIAFMSHPAVAEDGYAISESFAKRLAYYKVTKRTINLTKDHIPLNINGDDCLFKFLPGVGELVRPDGLLCAYREANNWFSVIDMSDEALSEFDSTFDIPVYVPVNSFVTNITITRGNYGKPELASGMTEQLDSLAEANNVYYTTIINRYEQIVDEKIKICRSEENFDQTPRLRRFITDKMAILNAANSNRIKLCHRKLPIDQYRIEVTVASVVIPTYGDKLTDFSAAKGVITAVIPDHHMPVDENGVYADVISDDTSTVSRMNLSRVYHGYLGAYSRDNKHRMRTHLFNKYGANYINMLKEEDIAECIAKLRSIYAHINTDLLDFLVSLDYEEQEAHVKECLQLEINLYYPTDNEYNIVDIIDGIEQTDLKPHLGHVTFIDPYGIQKRSEEPVRICNTPIMLLDKITANGSSVSSARTNSFNFPIKGGNIDKHKYPHSLTPTTTLSETEVRILSSFAPPVMIAEMIDLAMSPVSHKNLVKQIYNSDKAFDPNLMLDREVNPYGSTKSLGLLRHIFTAAGFDVKYYENTDVEQ